MRGIQNLHPWNVSPREARAIQQDLEERVATHGVLPLTPRTVAGVDIGLRGKKTGLGAIVILRYPDLEILEQKVVEEPVSFPYVPGLLSFREIPVLLKAFEQIQTEPDVIFVDGQGRIHPRRFGMACHLGVILDRPTIGCAKSLLCGAYEKPVLKKGRSTPVVENGETLGAALCTKDHTREIFVSVGHKIDLEQAISLTLSVTGKYRLPEPTRLADRAAKLYKTGGLARMDSIIP